MPIAFYDEKVYQKNYLSSIYEELPEDIKSNYFFCVMSSHPREIKTSLNLLHNIDSNNLIVFDLSDEWHTIPQYYENEKVKYILKEYCPFNYLNYKKLIPLPTFCNYEKSKNIKQKKINEKSNLFFTSMWLTPSREKLKKELKQFESKDKFTIKWNSDFATGFDCDSYIKMLNDSLITICPNGYMSPEITKFGEAICCGNIIITTRRPDYPYYKNFKLFIYDQEEEIPKIIESILKLTTEELQSIQDNNNKFFHEQYGHYAIAKKIKNILTKD